MKKRYHTPILIAVAVLVCIVLCVGGMFVSHWYAENYFNVGEGDNAQALLGDSFGAVNALISAFAFAGVIVAIFVERQELALQREDISLQRREFVLQNKTLQLQRFENTFFNMLTLQQRIVLDLCHKDGHSGKTVQGRELFFFAFEHLPHPVTWRERQPGKTLCGMRQYLESEGIAAYDKCHTPSCFDHYFRHLYTIIKFIDNIDFFSFDEKYKYTTMVRATLSRYELVWLFYNGISEVGNPKFKRLIEKYSLLKNIREDLLTLSRENKDCLHRNGAGSSTLLAGGYSGTDYNFWTTLQPDVHDKYHIGAFYSKNDLDEGMQTTRAMFAFMGQFK